MSFLVLLGVAITVFVANRAPKWPDVVWYCAGTGEVRAAPDGDELDGYELDFPIFPRGPGRYACYLRRDPGLIQQALTNLRVSETRSIQAVPMHPSGRRAFPDGITFEEYRGGDGPPMSAVLR